MPKIKCPVCGTAHRKYPLKCVAEVDNRYTHVVIAGYTSGKSTTREEKIAKAKESYFNPKWVDETIELKDQMDEYLKQFERKK